MNLLLIIGSFNKINRIQIICNGKHIVGDF